MVKGQRVSEGPTELKKYQFISQINSRHHSECESVHVERSWKNRGKKNIPEFTEVHLRIIAVKFVVKMLIVE